MSQDYVCQVTVGATPSNSRNGVVCSTHVYTETVPINNADTWIDVVSFDICELPSLILTNVDPTVSHEMEHHQNESSNCHILRHFDTTFMSLTLVFMNRITLTIANHLVKADRIVCNNNNIITCNFNVWGVQLDNCNRYYYELVSLVQDRPILCHNKDYGVNVNVTFVNQSGMVITSMMRI